MAERGPVYEAVLLGAVLVGGAWIATTVSAAHGSFTAALITVVVLAALLVVAHRHGW